MMRRCGLVALAFVILAATRPAQSQEFDWPDETQSQLAAATAAFADAAGVDDRLTAFGGVQTALEAADEAPGAELMLRLAGAQVGGEAGLGQLQKAVAALAGANTPEALEQQAAMVAGAVAALHPDDPNAQPVLPSTVLALSDAIAAYDAAAEDAGLPSFRETALRLLPESVRERVSGVLDRIDQAAEIARDLADLAAGDADAAERVAQGYFELFPPNPALAGQQVAITDLLAWDARMYGASANALNVIANGIETAQVDTAALSRITDVLHGLSRGPWGIDTIRDMMRSFCGQLPVLSDLCEAVAGAVIRDPALAVWEGDWQTGWGQWHISQWGGGLQISGPSGGFLDRWDITMTVAAATAQSIGGNYVNATFDWHGAFSFQMEADGRSFTGEVTGDEARGMTGAKL